MTYEDISKYIEEDLLNQSTVENTKMTYEEIYEISKHIEGYLLDRATGGEAKNKEYEKARDYLIKFSNINDEQLKEVLPEMISHHISLQHFWNMIKSKSDTYEGRRIYIQQEFANLFLYLETKIHKKANIEVEIPALSNENISSTIEKIKTRLNQQDYKGVITASKTLIEEILVELYKEIYNEQPKYKTLPELYKPIKEKLNLHINQGLDDSFKKIYSGLNSIIDGIAHLRNKTSDAHANDFESLKHHAYLIANSSFTLANFLCDIYFYQIQGENK